MGGCLMTDATRSVCDAGLGTAWRHRFAALRTACATSRKATSRSGQRVTGLPSSGVATNRLA